MPQPPQKVPYDRLTPGRRYSVTILESHVDVWLTGRFYGYGDQLRRVYVAGDHAKFDTCVIRLRGLTGAVRFDEIADDQEAAAA